MEKNTIVIAEWGPNNEKSSNYNIFVGRYQGEEESHTASKIYGICLEVMDESKDCQLHGYSIHHSNLRSHLAENHSKEEIRQFLIDQLNKALDHLFSEESAKEADDYTEYISHLFRKSADNINNRPN